MTDFYVGYDQFDETIDFSIHSQRNDVTRYSMSLDKFLKSLQISISDFDKNELEDNEKSCCYFIWSNKKNRRS